MLRSVTALLLSAALAVTAVAPGPALAQTRTTPESPQQPDQQAIGALIFGLTALAVLGAMARNAADDDDDDDRRRIEVPPPARRSHDSVDPRDRVVIVPRDPGHSIVDPRDRRPAFALPARCLNRIQTRNGPVNLFTRRCLREAGIDVHALPDQCYRRVEARSGNMRHGWAAQCLDRRGYHLATRR